MCCSFGEVAIVGEATETADDQRFLEPGPFESVVTDHMIRHTLTNTEKEPFPRKISTDGQQLGYYALLSFVWAGV